MLVASVQGGSQSPAGRVSPWFLHGDHSRGQRSGRTSQGSPAVRLGLRPGLTLCSRPGSSWWWVCSSAAEPASSSGGACTHRRWLRSRPSTCPTPGSPKTPLQVSQALCPCPSSLHCTCPLQAFAQGPAADYAERKLQATFIHLSSDAFVPMRNSLSVVLYVCHLIFLPYYWCIFYARLCSSWGLPRFQW